MHPPHPRPHPSQPTSPRHPRPFRHLPFLFSAALFLIPHVALAHQALEPAPHVIHAPLEARQPRPLRPGSSKGFHPILHLHDPTPPPQNQLQAALHRILPRVVRKHYHSVPLYGGMVAVGEYYARIQLGGQTVRVQIDTGSATLAVPLAECKNCKTGDMRYSVEKSNSGMGRQISCDDEHCGRNSCSMYGCGKCSATQACCAHSDTTMCAFHLNFGDGSGAKGILVEDELSWGDMKFPIVFGGIRSDSPDFERSQVDGIMGMAYPSLACNPSCITPMFESLRNNVTTMKDIFSICITYDSGKIVLGAYDRALSTQGVHWVPLEISHPPSFYSFPLVGKLQMNDEEVDLPYYRRAIVDSGTTLIVFSHQTFDAFKRQLQSKYCDVPGLCGPDSWFRPAHCTRISNADRDKLPTLKFGLQNFVVTLEPTDYLINYASKGPEYWCVGLMALNSMSGGVDVIFGNTVMKKYVTVYDRKNSRVGFALSDTKCGTERGAAGSPSPEPTPSISPVAPGGAVPVPTPLIGRSTPIPGTGLSSGVDCGLAKNCTSCFATQGKKCMWNAAELRCEEGDGAQWVCALENLPGNILYIIGGAVTVVVVAVVVVALVVAAYRKRRYSPVSQDQYEDGELEELAREPGQRGAFALDDEDES